jgi:hypothetical protein
LWKKETTTRIAWYFRIYLCNQQDKEGYVCLICKDFSDDDRTESIRMQIEIQSSNTGPKAISGLNMQFRMSILGSESGDINSCKDLQSVSTREEFPIVETGKLDQINHNLNNPWKMIANNDAVNAQGKCNKNGNGKCVVDVLNNIELKHYWRNAAFLVKIPLAKVVNSSCFS